MSVSYLLYQCSFTISRRVDFCLFYFNIDRVRNIFTASNLLICIISIADGDSEKVERDNSTDSAVPIAGASTASGVGRREGEAGHDDGTQCHYRGEYHSNLRKK